MTRGVRHWQGVMMTALAVATLIVGMFVISHEVSPISAGCGSIFLPDQHHALVGHSFLTQTGTGRIQCMMLCWRHSRCLSFNHDDTSGTCQLNHARKEEFPESYKQDGRLSYFGSSNKRHKGAFETTAAADKAATTAPATTTTAPATTTTAPATTTTAAATTTTAPATTTTAAATTTTAAATTTTAPATTTTAAATTTIAAATTTTDAATTTAATTPTTTTTAAVTTYNVCSSPYGLGMESGAINDSQITTNNALYDDFSAYGPTHARFNSNGAWCGKRGEVSWIKVDLGRTAYLYAIIVQGRKAGGQYVSEFTLGYSDDGNNWTYLLNEDGLDKKLYSNGADTTDVLVSLESATSAGMIRCRYIRIKPGNFQYEKCMRFEIIGCD